MKKLMVVVAAFTFAAGVYAADAVKADAAAVKADVAVVKADVAVVCADCAKLNVDKKADAAAKLCAACEAKKAAAAKAAAPVAK